MNKSTSEQSNRFKLEVMLPLEKDKETTKSRIVKRSSLCSIPPISLADLFKRRPEKNEPEVKKSEKLGDALCNSYKFVVNYGVFEANFEWMPLEILIRIFNFLNTRDLLAAGMVCRQWMEATQYFRLTRKILLHFQVFKYSERTYPMNRFLCCSRFFPNIKFSIVKFTPKNDSYWTDFGDVVEELTFNSCLINKLEFLHIIRLCPNLKFLNITRCEDLYKSWSIVKKLSLVKLKFPSMKTLSISETSHMTKAIFDFLVASAPNLTSLTLNNCFGDATAKNRIAVMDSLIDFVTAQATQMKVLNIANTQIDEIWLNKLADVKKLRLHELRFTFNGVVSTTARSGVVELLRNQREIKVLDVSDSKGLSNYCLTEICRNIPDLRKLYISRCWLINDGGLRELSRLASLEVLSVSGCDRITDLGLLEGLIPHGKKPFKLRELYVGLLPYMSILAIYRLAQQHDELEVLDLSGSSNSITDEALQMIFRYQRGLRYLNLDCCAKITDFGITGLTDQSEHGNYKNYVSFNLSNLTELRYLNLGGCYQISDKSFINTLGLRQMKEINLSRCHNITKVGMSHLCKNSSDLEIVDLSECFSVTDGVIELLTKELKWLQTLKLNGCKQITSEILYSISTNCKYLKTLYIRRCPNIIVDPFDVLKDVRYIYNR